MYALILLLVLICFFIEVLSQDCLQWRAPGAMSPGRSHCVHDGDRRRTNALQAHGNCAEQRDQEKNS
jgi:hypothetical protein